MNSKNVRDGIKAGVYAVTQIGAGVLLGAVGGTLLRTINCNIILKGLAAIGWLGLSSKVSDVAAEGMVDTVDNVFNIVDYAKEGIQQKTIG